MRITMIMGNTSKVDIRWTRPLRYESAGRLRVPTPVRRVTRGPAEPGALSAQADFSRGVRRDMSRGTIVGLTFSSTASRVITTRSTSLRLGTSYITDCGTSSRIARSPRAPVPRRFAWSAMASRESGELQVHAVELEQPPVLPHQGVARLGQDLDERVQVQVVHAGDDRQPADESDHPELRQVFRHHFAELVGVRVPDPQDRVEAHPLWPERCSMIFSRPRTRARR